MQKNTNVVPAEASLPPKLDGVDRILLGLLSEDASRSYAFLGEKLHLSAPAVHERVKRLKRQGVIVASVAKLDPVSVGRPLLCFIQVMTNTIAHTRQIAALADLPDVEEIHTVAGDCGLLMKVRTRDMKSLEELLATIHGVDGVSGTRTQMVLSTLMERGPSPLLA
ncbi:Lrp/AsnC family transcriptional regulator [Cupriavidus plantarum]|uniref:Lrp/AsnC family transcriptional regulator n=1 Tax=Cupriavidus plantarum TaxID=942865 RepID=UPI00339D33C6